MTSRSYKLFMPMDQRGDLSEVISMAEKYVRSETRGDLKILTKPKNSCQGFSHFATKLWNKLPVEIRNKTKPLDFKAAIKCWIFINIPN